MTIETNYERLRISSPLLLFNLFVLVHLHDEHLRKKAFIRVVQFRERADFEHPNRDVIA